MIERSSTPQGRREERTRPAALVRALGGSATLDQLLRHTTRARLRSALATGELTRVARGRYVVPDLSAPQFAAATARGALSHASAAQHWGLQLVHQPTSVQVTVPHGARPAAAAGVVLHWSSTLGPDDVHADGVTSPLRTVLDCATELPFREALAVADSALALRFVQADQLREAAARSRGRGRPGRLAVAAHADPRAANALESALRGTVIQRGFTGFEPQHELRVRGRDWHVDLGDPACRVALEAEGYETHGSRAAFARDCERYTELVSRGWLVLRFAWEHVMFQEDWVGDAVADVMGLRSR